MATDDTRPAYDDLAAVVREIGESDPLQHIEARYDTGDNVHQCRYCGVEQPWPYDMPVHERSCYWVRCHVLAARLKG